ANRLTFPTASLHDALPIYSGEKPWLEVLRDFSDLDVMAVATPDNLHTEVILAALNAGAHVITEKPMCLDIAEADQIIELAQKKRSEEHTSELQSPYDLVCR